MGWGLVVAVCLAAPLANRLLLVQYKGFGLSLVDLRGLFADLSVSILALAAVSVLLVLRHPWGRVAAFLLMAALLFISFAMFEFISVYGSLYALSHAEFLADPTFLGGSVRNIQHPGLVVVMVVLAVVATVLAEPQTGRLWWASLGVVFASSVFVQVAFPVSHEYDEWRQRHALQANLGAMLMRPGTAPGGTISADVGDVFRSNLSGHRWIGPVEDHPNVILIMVEGVSTAYLPSVAARENIRSTTTMPKLDALAKDHILFTHIVSHQRQTNRGEYAILCGDYPKLATDQSKMTEQAYGKARRCLPALFKEAGYATAYIQAAPLGFMLKDQFMPKAGFDELIGDTWFERGYARTDWGVDDKAFFEQALGRIVDLHAEDPPFFATLLTVGTHHPYTFPESLAPAGLPDDRQAGAFRWADEAVDWFLEELERRGVLRDTIVIVTSDESAGTTPAASAIQRLLSQSWSFVLIMLPDPLPKQVDDLYGHVDLALSVADLLGWGDRARNFIGRSMFRQYDAPRRLFAGNTFARTVIMWEPAGGAVLCDEAFDRCVRAVCEQDGYFGPVIRTEAPSPRAKRLLMDVTRMTQSGRDDMTSSPRLALLSKKKARVPAADGRKLIVGGQHLRVPAGTAVRVDFDLEAHGDPNATVELHQRVFLNGHVRFERKDVRLQVGDRWRLSYAFGAPMDSSHLVVELYARTVAGEGTELRIRDASLSMRREIASEEPTVIWDEVIRGQ